MKDLVIVAADKNAEFAIGGALRRPHAAGIRSIDFEIKVHPGRDGGARKDGVAMLALEKGRFGHGLLILDFDGCGTRLSSAIELEAELDRSLEVRWGRNAKAIAIEPELDVWAWGSDNAMGEILDWPPGTTIRGHLRRLGFELRPDGKPVRPKEALEAILKVRRLPRSASLYARITGRISLDRCTDSAFKRLRRQLVEWFPVPSVGNPT